jgi:hypothetical protein
MKLLLFKNFVVVRCCPINYFVLTREIIVYNNNILVIMYSEIFEESINLFELIAVLDRWLSPSLSIIFLTSEARKMNKRSKIFLHRQSSTYNILRSTRLSLYVVL